MNDESLRRLKQLLTSQRVLSLAVLIDGQPHIGLLPYALSPDSKGALVHASKLARHSRGLQPGAPFSLLVHAPDQPDSDPLQVPRVTLNGEVRVVDRDAAEYSALREAYLRRLPEGEVTFELGDFTLYELQFHEGRFVEGFAAAVNVTSEDLRRLAE
jgi:putative heme iron utilization protein